MSRATAGCGDRRVLPSDILQLLRQIIPYTAASLTTRHPATEEHASLASHGYPPSVLEHLNGAFTRADELYRHMRHRDARALRWRDAPFAYHESASVLDHFHPAGFEEGFSALLFSTDNRYTGMLHVSVDDPDVLTDTAMQSVVWLQTLLAPVVDPWVDISAICNSLAPGAWGLVVGSDGSAYDVPYRTPPLTIRDRHRLTQRIREEWGTWGPGATQRLWAVESGDRVAIWMQRIRNEVLVVGAAQAPSDLAHNLTNRELAVLEHVVAGRTNIQAASRLSLSPPRTVEKHVENVLAKTGADSRTHLCALALREGFTPLPGTF